MQQADNLDIVFQPIAGTSQVRALNAPVHHLLLTGGRGWGKTTLQLMRFRSRVGMGYGAYWRGIIFDREYKNLDDLVVKSKQLFYELDGGDVQFLNSTSAFKWVWNTGEELLFRVAEKEEDYWAYHGHEYAYIGWNELTKYYDGKLYNRMLSVNRTGFDPIEHTPRWTQSEVDDLIKRRANYIPEIGSYKTDDGKPLPPIPLEVVSTTNPYGPGHNWVKSRFIDPAPYGKIVTRSYTIYNPKSKQDEMITRYQVALFGSFRENPYLSPEYIAGLHEETDENILKAWIKGDWNIVAGGALDDKWKPDIHVIPRFRIPPTWTVDRALDWGSSHPFSVGWFAEANGDEATLIDGTKFCPPPGTIIQIAEWYGTKAIGTNEGIKLSAKDLAKGIIEIEQELLNGGWITKKPYPGPADNQISNVTETGTDTIEKKMADNGVTWEKSDKAPGSRANGLQLIRDRLEASIRKEGPGLLFMDNCRASIATIPVLPRDKKHLDDVDSKAEDHPYDMLRYRVLKGNLRSATVIPISFFR